MINDKLSHHGPDRQKGFEFSKREYPEISTNNLRFIRDTLDWEVENSRNYQFDDYRSNAFLDRTVEKFGLPNDDRFRIQPTDQNIKRSMQSKNIDSDVQEMSTTDRNDSELEITVHVSGMNPLAFICDESSPILKTLFQSLIKNSTAGTSVSDEVIYLQYEESQLKTLYLLRSQILAIETDPPVSEAFIALLED